MTKPSGPIPPYYCANAEGVLLAGGAPVDTLLPSSEQTPIFIYDFNIIVQRIGDLRAAMPATLGIHYAIKANSHAGLLARMAGKVDGFDVASGGELAMALKAGMAADDISFAGPGKRDAELEAAIVAGATLNLESESEADRALAIADRLGTRARLAVRVNPDFDLKGSGMRMGGGAKPFGVDASRVPALCKAIIASGADWRGLHIFAGSQSLDSSAIIETQGQTLALAQQIADEVGTAPPLVNLGGGFGVPYFSGDAPVDIGAIGAALGAHPLYAAMEAAGTGFAIELGRWLVAEAGIYVTRIIDKKVSHGETFLVTDGGLHHQLAASGNFGTVVRRNYPIAIAEKFGAKADGDVHVVGCLCTPLDKLGDQVALPDTDVGDLVVIFLAGAYGRSASPSAFLGHPPAAELLIG